MEGLQVLDRARATEVERVLADAHVARAVSLSLRDVREFVLDHRALAKRLAASGRLDLVAEAVLQRLVLCDRHGAAMAELGGCTARAPGTVIAHVGIEFDDRSHRKALHLALGTCDRAVAEVEGEGGLGEQAAVRGLPGFAHNATASAEYVVHKGAVDVSAI